MPRKVEPKPVAERLTLKTLFRKTGVKKTGEEVFAASYLPDEEENGFNQFLTRFRNESGIPYFSNSQYLKLVKMFLRYEEKRILLERTREFLQCVERIYDRCPWCNETNHTKERCVLCELKDEIIKVLEPCETY